MKTILYLTLYHKQREQRFFSQVREALLRRGYELYVVSPEENFGDGPGCRMPHYGLDNLNLAANGKTQRWVKDWGIDETAVLKRERLWSVAKENVARRTAAIRAFAGAYASLLSSIRPNLVLFWSGELSQQLIMRQLAERCGCPMAFAERAPLPGMIYVDRQGVLANASFAGGDKIEWTDEDTHRQWQEKFAAYRQHMLQSGHTWYNQPQSVGGNELRQRLGVPDGAKVALFAGQVDQDAQCFLCSPHYSTNLEAFLAFCEMMRRIGNVFVLGKQHPWSNTLPGEYKKVARGVGTWLTDASLSDCLEASDCVVAVNSSVLLDGAMCEKPSLSMGKTLVDGRGVLFEMQSPDDIETVEAWLADENHDEHKANWEETGAWFMAKHLFAMEDGPVLDQLRGPVEFAERLIPWAENAEPDYSPLAFGHSTVADLFCESVHMHLPQKIIRRIVPRGKMMLKKMFLG